jgi:hypothetical protein
MIRVHNPYPLLPLPLPYPFLVANKSSTNNSDKAEIIIGKKKGSDSKLTGDNIKYLRNKISDLNELFNIIIKHVCDKVYINKNKTTDDLLREIKADLSAKSGFLFVRSVFISNRS